MTFLPELDAPVPVLAETFLFPNRVFITFSTVMKPAIVDKRSWSVRIGNQAYTIDSAEVKLFGVELMVTPGAGDPGANVVSFAPPPFDVVSAAGHVPAPAFADFPIT